jgi:hypothetical protein
VEAVQNGREPAVNGEAGRAALALALDINAAMTKAKV